MTATVVGPGGSISVTGEVEVKNDTGSAIPVSDGGGSLTVDGTVAVTGPVTDTQLRATPVPVSDGNTTLSVDDGGGSLTVDGTVAVSGTVPVSGTFYQATQPVSGTVTASGPLTDTQLRAATVPVSGTVSTGLTQPLTDAQLRASVVPVDSELTTLDYDSGAGTVAAAVTGVVVPGSGGPVAMTGDTTNGLDVDVTRLPALVAGTAVIGHVILDTTSTTAVTQATGTNLHAVIDAGSTTAVTQATGTNLHTVVDSGTVTTVSAVTAITNALPAGTNLLGKVGVDQTTIGTTNAVTVNKRAATTSLSPVYTANRLAAKATTTLTSATAYLQSLVICVSAAGTAMSITVQNKEGTAKIVYTVATATAGTTQPINLSEPFLMTSGIDIIIGGTTAGTVDIFTTYWQ